MAKMALGILDSLHGGDESSRAIAAEMTRRGHVIHMLDPSIVTLRTGDPTTFQFSMTELPALDAALYRGSFRNRADVEILIELENLGLYRFINSMDTYMKTSSKLRACIWFSKFGYPVPETLISNEVKECISFIEKHNEVVVKPIDGWIGDGVFRITKGDLNTTEFFALFLSKFPVALLQKMIVNEWRRDIRVYVVGQRAVGAVYRYASNDTFLTNVGKGGTLRPCELNSQIRELADRIGRDFRLELAGVDLIERDENYFVLEINPDPTWLSPDKMFGLDVAKLFSDYLEAQL